MKGAEVFGQDATDGPPRLAGIGRYPVKGLGGEALAEAFLGLDGIRFDRVLGLANGTVPLAAFGSWTSYAAFDALDTRPDLGGYSARLSPPRDAPDGTDVVLAAADGEELRVHLTAEGRLAVDPRHEGRIRAWFGSVELVSSGGHLWDFPDTTISIINLATVRELERVAGAPVDPRRFRANLYIDGLPPWAEFALAGTVLRIGEVDLEVLRPIERCRATAVEPGTGRTGLNVPRILTGHFGHVHCGMYAQVRTPGGLRVGDLVHCGEAHARTHGLSSAEVAAAPRIATVRAVGRSSVTATSIEIDDPSGALATALPGQYLRVHQSGCDTPGWRNYTISRGGDGPTRITVECQKGGAVSPWLSEMEAGQELLVTGPFGDSVLDAPDGSPLLVLTAGIGITPALAFAHALMAARSDRPVDFVHVARDLERVPHWDELEMAARKLSACRLHLFVTRQSAVPSAGRPDRDFIEGILDDPVHTRVHLCGPAAFVRDMRKIVETHGVPANSIHWDPFYSPRPVAAEPRPAPLAGPFEVRYGPSGVTAQWIPERGTLLDLAESQGLRPAAACRSGVCGRCAATVHGDTAYLVDPLVDAPSGQVLLCSSVPVSDVVVESTSTT